MCTMTEKQAWPTKEKVHLCSDWNVMTKRPLVVCVQRKQGKKAIRALKASGYSGCRISAVCVHVCLFRECTPNLYNLATVLGFVNAVVWGLSIQDSKPTTWELEEDGGGKWGLRLRRGARCWLYRRGLKDLSWAGWGKDAVSKTPPDWAHSRAEARENTLKAFVSHCGEQKPECLLLGKKIAHSEHGEGRWNERLEQGHGACCFI